LHQHYNLVERDKYEGELLDLVAHEGLSSIPNFALASGFLKRNVPPPLRYGAIFADAPKLDDRRRSVPGRCVY
jgi:aryl-alcohol dehydrogenase-like predicted oxidoreductase